MPNWATNILTVEGDNDKVQDFMTKVQKQKQDYPEILESLIPCPEELAGTTSGHYTEEPHPNWANLLANGDITQDWYDELVTRNAEGYARDQENLSKYGYKDWYDWQVSNWGTKWGDSETELVNTGDGWAEYRFQTPWSPPLKGMATISTMFPDLTFVLNYYEEGMGFAGCAGFRNGKSADYSTEDINLPEEEEDSWDDADFWQAVDNAYVVACDSCEGHVRLDMGSW